MSNLVRRHGEVMPQDWIASISERYHSITKAVNKTFWNSVSDTAHSLYVGSYGRNTAIKTSDIDILVELPSCQFDHYNNLSGNSQSKLLQAVRSAIKVPYYRSNVHADGQVVIIDFSDGMRFEILPAFKNCAGIYVYPDSNKGGKWRSTNPRAEQEAMAQKNRDSKGLFNDTCRHIRRIRDDYFPNAYLAGIVIDSFVFEAMGDYKWTNVREFERQPSVTYEQYLYYRYLTGAISDGQSITVPGSNNLLPTYASYECLGKILEGMI